LETEDYEVNK